MSELKDWHVEKYGDKYLVLDEDYAFIAETLTKSEATLIAAVPQMKQTLETFA